MPRINLIPKGDLPNARFPIASFGKGLGNLNNMPTMLGFTPLNQSKNQDELVSALKAVIVELEKEDLGVFNDACMIAFDFSWSKCRNSLEDFLDSFGSWKHCSALSHDVYMISQEMQEEVSSLGKKLNNSEFHELALKYASKIVETTSKYTLNNLPETLNTYPKYFAGFTRESLVKDAHSLLLHVLAGYEIEWDE